MDWQQHSIHTLKKIFEDESYKDWSDAVREGAINDFPKNLDSLLGRLAGVLMSDLELSPNDKEKIERILELAALAGERM